MLIENKKTSLTDPEKKLREDASCKGNYTCIEIEKRSIHWRFSGVSWLLLIAIFQKRIYVDTFVMIKITYIVDYILCK